MREDADRAFILREVDRLEDKVKQMEGELLRLKVREDVAIEQKILMERAVTFWMDAALRAVAQKAEWIREYAESSTGE